MRWQLHRRANGSPMRSRTCAKSRQEDCDTQRSNTNKKIGISDRDEQLRLTAGDGALCGGMRGENDGSRPNLPARRSSSDHRNGSPYWWRFEMQATQRNELPTSLFQIKNSRILLAFSAEFRAACICRTHPSLHVSTSHVSAMVRPTYARLCLETPEHLSAIAKNPLPPCPPCRLRKLFRYPALSPNGSHPAGSRRGLALESL